MTVGIDEVPDGLVGDGPDGGEKSLSANLRYARVNHDDAVFGDHESDVLEGVGDGVIARGDFGDVWLSDDRVLGIDGDSSRRRRGARR
jgi:hypothetical protein